jgi:uroporphyrinogen decarboxylase
MIKRKAPQAKVLFHNDGAIRKFIPDLIETGFDILNPLKVTCAGWTLSS